jgi:hypothetical protein
VTTTARPIDPRHGPAAPTAGTPARRPGSIRRTSTIDSTRPEGFGGPLHQFGRARDLVTAVDGIGSALAEAEMRVVTDYTGGMVVRELETTPQVPRVDAFVGARAGGGFRKILDLETGAERGSLPYLLLDDVPGATLVSGFAMTVAAERGDPELAEFRARMRGEARLPVADLCAGWQTGGALLTNLVEGRPPALLGPLAPPVTDADDPQAWHALEPLPADSTRRARRIDVWRDDLVHVDVFFRDSTMGADGEETVIHEYTVVATVDAASMTVVSCHAAPRVLPWLECPQAIGSETRLVGWPVLGLRPEVRTQLVGPSTCTHLNDVLRGLEDVAWLTDALPA